MDNLEFTIAPALPICKTLALRCKFRALLNYFRLWHMRQRTRAQLAQLDQRMLSDLGISRADALHEANKPFWKE